MKKIFKITSLLFLAVSLLSCDDTGKFRLIKANYDVEVGPIALDQYQVGDTLFLELRQGGDPSKWELLQDESLNFNKIDTTFIFESIAGPYDIRIAKAILKSKY